MRHSRGSPPGSTSDSREAMTSLFAAPGKDFPSTLALHAFAEAVFLVTTAHMVLKSTFRQRILSSIFAGCAALAAELAHRMPLRTQANLVVYSTVAARSRKRASPREGSTRKLAAFHAENCRGGCELPPIAANKSGNFSRRSSYCSARISRSRDPFDGWQTTERKSTKRSTHARE